MMSPCIPLVENAFKHGIIGNNDQVDAILAENWFITTLNIPLQ
jgi:sensor histidine kinase YesM